MNVPFVDLKRQYESIRDEVDTAIQRILDTTSFIGGKELSSFEEEFASFCKAHHTVGVSSGTSALQLALIAHGVGGGDEVVTVSHTFTATAEAIVNVGARPVFTDVDEKTGNMDAGKLEDAITAKTKVVLPVHLYGQPADLDQITEVAEEKGLVVIEDAAQAHAAEYKGRRIGSVSTTCFSFYPGKNLGAYGDAGAVTTNDEEIADKIRMLRDHGRTEKYVHEKVGFNERMDALQAAVLKVKLTHLEEWTEARRKNAGLYGRLLRDTCVEAPFEADYARHVYHLYVVQADDRDGLREHLEKAGVATGIHYPLPLHLQPAYSSLGYAKGDFPVTERLTERILSLPMFPELKKEELEYVCEKIGEF
ncbi:MAG: DegT/DnrJ/EryC1/StrS family aminotransferase [Candidatus Altiarchaeota archaeon]